MLLAFDSRDVADVPGADHVKTAKDLGPFGILFISPIPLTAADERDGIFGIALEETDDAIRERGVETITVKPPDEEDRLSVVMQISSILGDLLLINQPLPIRDH